jgi:hypothetical protein
MDDLAQLLARDEIRQLALRYALAIDSLDIDTLVGLFVDDVQVGRNSFGRRALRENFDRQLREVGITILFVGNHLIDFQDEDHASGRPLALRETPPPALVRQWRRREPVAARTGPVAATSDRPGYPARSLAHMESLLGRGPRTGVLSAPRTRFRTPRRTS